VPPEKAEVSRPVLTTLATRLTNNYSRCDRSDPCGACVKSNLPACVYKSNHGLGVGGLPTVSAFSKRGSFFGTAADFVLLYENRWTALGARELALFHLWDDASLRVDLHILHRMSPDPWTIHHQPRTRQHHSQGYHPHQLLRNLRQAGPPKLNRYGHCQIKTSPERSFWMKASDT
jgi:hypothetical protein